MGHWMVPPEAPNEGTFSTPDIIANSIIGFFHSHSYAGEDTSIFPRPSVLQHTNLSPYYWSTFRGRVASQSILLSVCLSLPHLQLVNWCDPRLVGGVLSPGAFFCVFDTTYHSDWHETPNLADDDGLKKTHTL